MISKTHIVLFLAFVVAGAAIAIFSDVVRPINDTPVVVGALVILLGFPLVTSMSSRLSPKRAGFFILSYYMKGGREWRVLSEEEVQSEWSSLAGAGLSGETIRGWAGVGDDARLFERVDASGEAYVVTPRVTPAAMAWWGIGPMLAWRNGMARKHRPGWELRLQQTWGHRWLRERASESGERWRAIAPTIIDGGLYVSETCTNCDTVRLLSRAPDGLAFAVSRSDDVGLGLTRWFGLLVGYQRRAEPLGIPDAQTADADGLS